MNISLIFAQFFGISFMILGLSMLFNKRWTSSAVEAIMDNKGIIWLAGLVTVLLGSITVVMNNIWTSGVPLVITIIGWLTLIKGATILIFPNFTSSYYKNVNKGNLFVWAGLIIVILSVALLYYA